MGLNNTKVCYTCVFYLTSFKKPKRASALIIVIMPKLFVYGVTANCPKEELQDTFGKYGEVTDVYNTGKGFAFVTMEDQDGADQAIKNLNRTEIDGQEIKVGEARAREDRGGRNGSSRGYGD